MKLVVGLGNPGSRYSHTRHNLGFMVVDALAERWKLSVGGRRYESELGSGTFAGERVLLAKPQTFMNASGEAVGKLRRLHKLDPVEILAVYDDLDLAVGRVRLRADGGAGGHNGVASLIAVLGKGFPRLRIGIGRPPGGADPVGFVLEPFSDAERPIVREALVQAVAGVESWLEHGIERAMNMLNRKPSAA